MGIVVDIVIILILLLCIWQGYRKGLIGIALKILSFFVALIVAFILYKPCSAFIIEHTQIDETIQSAIIEKSKNTDQQGSDPKAQGENKELPQAILNYANQYIEDAASNTKEMLVQQFSADITRIIIQAITGIGLFVIANILLLILKAFSDLVAKLPIIKQFNKTGGILFGVIKGLFTIYLLLGVFSLVVPMLKDSILLEAIIHSTIGSFMYYHNVLLHVIFS